MKAIYTGLLFLWFIPVVASSQDNQNPKRNKIAFIRSFSLSEDTAEVNRIVSKGIEKMKKEAVDLKDVRKCIDSAFVLCERKKIEPTPQLLMLNAEYLFNTGDYKDAEVEALNALEAARSNSDYLLEARIMLFLGRYYRRTGFYRESDDYFSGSIELAERRQLKGIIPRAWYGLAELYGIVNDLKSFRESYEMMAESAFREADTLSAVIGLYLLGTHLAERIRNFEEADSVLRRCIDVARLNGLTAYVAMANANLGWNFYLEKMYDSALVCYNRSLTYSIPGNHYESSANSLGNLGTIYRDLGKPEKAIPYYKKAIHEAMKIKDFYSLSWVHLDVSNMYLKMGDTANAFTTYVRYKEYTDTLNMQRNTQGMDEARIRYEADMNRKEVELLSLRLRSQRLLMGGIGLILISILAIGYLLQRSARHKANRKISEMNMQIAEIKQANLRQQMNPHFIFNTLNSIQYFMYQHDKLATNNYLTKFSNLMRKVLDNSRHTSVTLSDELAALSLYLELESIRFKDRFEYSVNVDEEIDPYTYKVPTMLIQPYVENSINHGLIPKEGKGWVKVDISLEPDHLLCTITDNGIGRDASRDKKMKMETNHNSHGTEIVSSRLELVNSLYGTNLKTIYTDLKGNDGNPEGTRVEIHIPFMI